MLFIMNIFKNINANTCLVTDAQITFRSFIFVRLWTANAVHDAHLCVRNQTLPLESFSTWHLDRTGSARRTKQPLGIKHYEKYNTGEMLCLKLELFFILIS